MLARLCPIAFFGSVCALAGPATAPNPTETKLKSLIIPAVSFDEATFEEAVGFVFAKARALDPETDPEKKGVNIVLSAPPTGITTTMTFEMEGVSVHGLLTRIAETAGLELSVEAGTDAVRLHPKGEKAPPSPRRLPEELTPIQKLALERLEETILPKVELDDATVEEAVQYLLQRLEAHSEPKGQDVSILIRHDEEPAPAADATLTLKLKDVPAAIVLDYICDLSELRWTITERGPVLITPR